MKFKRKILTIISSCFGVLALCGLSVFSFLDHKKDNNVQSVSATSTLVNLDHADMYVSSNDLVHYSLASDTVNTGYNINTSTVSGERWILTLSNMYMFSQGSYYDLTFTIPASAAARINPSVAPYYSRNVLDYVSILIGGNNNTWYKENAQTFRLRFYVNVSSFDNVNWWAALIDGPVSFSGSTFVLKKGRIYPNNNYLSYDLMKSYYDTYGPLSGDYDIYYYYNGVLYNGLHVRFSYVSTFDNFIVNVTTLRATLEPPSGIYFINNCLYQMTANLQFISGSDTQNTNLLRFLNHFFTLSGYNTYDIATTTIQQYEEIIASLNEQIDELKSVNSELSDTLIDTQQSNGYLYNQGYEDGVASIESQLESTYSEGYAAGYDVGFNSDSTATTIVSGIFQVALVPINFFLGLFNFTVLGINFTSLIQAIFTIALTIIVLKVVLGKKGD